MDRPRIQPHGQGHKGWIHLHQGKQRHIWTTTIRAASQQTPQKMTKQARLPAKQDGTRLLERRHATKSIHIGRRQF